ncbi:sensor histidine kinase [Streptomyces zaomyceticus]|uniref:sensor histidine kinase n=1 Tax=Streptomyces zaomyceticus TaxID=68286 RepID=UPI00371F97F0
MTADPMTTTAPPGPPHKAVHAPSARVTGADGAMAAVTVVAVCAGTALLDGRLDPGGTLPLALQLGLLLLVRRRWPIAVLLLGVQAVIVFRSAGLTDVGWVWPVTAAYFTLAATDRPGQPGRPGLPWAIGIGLVELGFAAAWEASTGAAPRTVLASTGAEALWLALVLAVATAHRDRLRWRAEVDAGVLRAAREREAEALRRIAEARLQIARELHDVVAHTLTVVGVQLRVAGEALDDSPDEARAALATAQRVRKDAVNDLRSLIDVLRDPDDESGDGIGEGSGDGIRDRSGDGIGDSRGGFPAPRSPARLAPQAGLDDLEALVDRIRSTGLEVRLETSGELSRAPAPASLAAYRVVQESLTNTVRHAGAARATVRVLLTGGALHVHVVDDGNGTGTGTGDTDTQADREGGGHGVRGMRERVRALGGTFEAGPDHPRGGYAVRAELPVPGFRP